MVNNMDIIIVITIYIVGIFICPCIFKRINILNAKLDPNDIDDIIILGTMSLIWPALVIIGILILCGEILMWIYKKS